MTLWVNSSVLDSDRFVVNYEEGILQGTTIVVTGKFQHTTFLDRNTKILSVVRMLFGINDQG